MVLNSLKISGLLCSGLSLHLRSFVQN